MKNEFMFDLNDRESSWIYPIVIKTPDGRIGEEQSTILMGEGPNRIFCVTDSIMHAIPEGTDPDSVAMPHEHRYGYETFFCDSGKMYLYIDGKKCLVKEGDILHLQAGQAHGMAFLEDMKYRGFFHDMNIIGDAEAVNYLRKYMQVDYNDPEFAKARGGSDFIVREKPLFKEVPAEEVSAVRHPDRPLAEYKLDGVTMKVIIQRWENAGVCELCCAEMEPGFTAEWVKYPKHRDLLYVRSGEVRFTVYDREFTAKAGCLVNIPKYAPHSLEALTKAQVYDVGGQTFWASFLHDYFSIKTYDPERFRKTETIVELKDKFGCQIRSIGKAG